MPAGIDLPWDLEFNPNRHHLRSIRCNRNSSVPQASLARICTGVWLASSVNQAQIWPLPFKVPEVASAATRKAW
jgi:hypothetical protein